MANEPTHRTAPDGRVGHGDEILLQRAKFALDQERPKEAELLVHEILKADPRQAPALHLLGCALLMQGRTREAIAPLETAAHGRHDPEFDTMLAIALHCERRNDEALRRLKLAIKRRPPYPVAFKELGYLLVSMKRYDEAVEVLSRGLEIAPMMPQLSIQLGFALLSGHDCVNARIAFARALELSPTSADALFGMAKSLQEAGENKVAVEYFRRYVVAMPGDQNALLGLGHCLLELGDLEAGQECFRAAARGDPRRYGSALTSLASAARGRFWLRPSDAVRFMSGPKS
jgi:tetratricopeptide (TPR) repeat protein